MARVGIDVSSAVDPRATGVARYIRHLVAALGELADRPEIRLYCRPSRLRRGRPWELFEGRRVRWLVPIVPCAVNVFHAPDLRAPRRVRGPLVVTIHDLHTWHHSDHASPGFVAKKRADYRRAASQATLIVTHTEAVRREISAELAFPLDRVAVIPLADPLDLPGSAPTPREHDLLLVVGGPSTRKGSHRLGPLLEVWARATAWRPRIAWVGSTPEPETHRFAAQLPADVRSRIRFLGHVADHELVDLYARATALVNLSDAEGFGLPLLEATTRGCPVVSVDTAPLREVLGEGAFWLDAEFDRSRSRLVEFLDAKERALTVARATHYAARFSWRQTATRTLAAYVRAAEIFGAG
ncbi:MAG: glycosyltransferase family 4 protein [Planctomycetota bacterium]